MSSDCFGSGKIKRNGGMSFLGIYGIMVVLFGFVLILIIC